ncbi:hypothetical protein Psesu_0655 [Pseudoxanthomonas suwonensis 11-1]|uniref:Tetratricopeptide repeat protein n=1 Tax=Pseudoxanthomonas suwonensis (strain 11-1) TaxID=743721 RepID=E6WQR2_PSEUU|nr:hypothetical protein Psesu_0655 [Pseudoxanthomonas suwonensis 11-1]
MRILRHPPGPQAVAGCILLLVGLLAWFLYGQARGLTWQFDDLINLRGLTRASTQDGLVGFVFGGIAGPGGRPLALASFLADYAYWPGDPWALVRHTLVWHMMTGALVFMFFLAVLRQHERLQERAMTLAAAAAAVWLLMPIHASGILMPVQRMTVMSGFFVMATLVAYVHLRVRLAGRGTVVPILILGLVCGTGMALAYLTKENGLLLLAFVPLVEWLLLPNLAAPGPWRLWRWGMRISFLAVPAALAWRLWDTWSRMQVRYTYDREFSLAERLASEAVILWEYLRHIFIPRAALLGPFHDGHAIWNWKSVLPWLAVLAFVILLVATWRMARRGSAAWRWAFFALAFYLAAHMMESTVIPLELYFEHRNYVAALGIAGLVVVAVDTALRNASSKAVVAVVVLVMGAYHVIMLQQTTSLWGNRLLAGEMWYQAHPSSGRAAQHLSWLYRQYDFDDASIAVLDRFSSAHTGRIDIGMQALDSSCRTGTGAALGERLERLIVEVPELRNPAGVAGTIGRLGGAIRAGKCQGIELERYKALLLALMENPRIQHMPRVRHHVDHELAAIALVQGDNEARLGYLRQAFDDYPSLSGAQVVARLLFAQGRNDEAIAWIEHALARSPDGLSRRAWGVTLGSLREAIVEVERLRSSWKLPGGDDQPGGVDADDHAR